MSILKKVYGYRVEYIKRGQWVPVVQTDIEETDAFRFVANSDERQYRILCGGADVTARYRNANIAS